MITLTLLFIGSHPVIVTISISLTLIILAYTFSRSHPHPHPQPLPNLFSIILSFTLLVPHFINRRPYPFSPLSITIFSHSLSSLTKPIVLSTYISPILFVIFIPTSPLPTHSHPTRITAILLSKPKILVPIFIPTLIYPPESI